MRNALARRLEVATTKRRIAVGAALACALCGCASVEPNVMQQAGVVVPATWYGADVGTGAGSTSLVGWWYRFDDPLLAQLIADALHANTSVVGARAALRQARALRDVAVAALLPTLGGSLSVKRSSGANRPPLRRLA